MRSERSRTGSWRTDEKWEQVCRWEKRESLRASGGQFEDGGSGELEDRTWPGRSEQGLETETESNAEGWE